MGHIFQLHNKYSEAMNAVYLDESGQPGQWKWDATGLGSRVSSRRPSSRTMTSVALFFLHQWRLSRLRSSHRAKEK